MNRNLTRSLAVLTLISAGFFLPGCTDEEVIESAVVIGAAALCASGPGCEVHTAPPPYYGPGPGPGFHGPGPFPGGPGPGPHGHFVAVKEVAAVVPSATVDPRVANFSAHYQISDYSSTLLVRAILLAQNGDNSGITDLGLQVSDFQEVYEGQTLSADKISTLSSKLLLSTDETTRVMTNISSDVQAEKEKRGIDN